MQCAHLQTLLRTKRNKRKQKILLQISLIYSNPIMRAILAPLLAVSTLSALDITTAPPLPAKADTLMFAPMHDGRILMTGFTTTDAFVGTVDLPLVVAYDPISNTYANLPDCQSPSRYGRGLVDADGNILFYRQTQGVTERFFQGSNTWSTLSGSPNEGTMWSCASAVESSIGTVMVAPYGTSWKFLSSGSSTWQSIPARPVTAIAPALCCAHSWGLL